MAWINPKQKAITLRRHGWQWDKKSRYWHNEILGLRAKNMREAFNSENRYFRKIEKRGY
jgi:hypothetical protein